MRAHVSAASIGSFPAGFWKYSARSVNQFNASGYRELEYALNPLTWRTPKGGLRWGIVQCQTSECRRLKM
jgi:hypothetical protein